MCPEIWAKLEYGARDADPAAVIAQIRRWKPQASGGTEEPILKLKLCGEDVEIRYEEKHMQRLQVLISGMPRESHTVNEAERQTVEMEHQAAPKEIQVQEPANVAQRSELLGVKLSSDQGVDGP